MNAEAKYIGRNSIREHYADGGNTHGNGNALYEQFANFPRPVFAGTATDQRLQAIVQTKSDGGKYEVIDTGNSGSGEGLFTQAAKKNIVGDEIELRHQYAKADRQGNAQDLAVGNFNL